jgi:hypothetical protein
VVLLASAGSGARHPVQLQRSPYAAGDAAHRGPAFAQLAHLMPQEKRAATLQLERQHWVQLFWRTAMSTLMIADLSVAHELDCREMSVVRGGYLGGGYPGALWPVYFPTPSVNVGTFSPQQFIGQSSEVVTNTGDDVAFSSGIRATVKPVQNAQNVINFESR